MNGSQQRNRSRKGTGPWLALGRVLARYRRERTHLSQHQLAERAGVSYSMVSLVERGQQHPTVTYLQKIAPALRLPVEHLLSLAQYTDAEGRWLASGHPQDTTSAIGAVDAPHDPLAALHAALQLGPWPEHIVSAVYALLATYAEQQQRPIPDVGEPTPPSSHTIVEWRSSELPPPESRRTSPDSQ